MRQSELVFLYEYSRWATQRILDAAEGIADGEFCAPYAPQFESLRSILVHTYGAEWIWRRRCEDGVSPAAMPAAEEFAGFAALRTRWLAEVEDMRLYIDGLSDTQIDATMSYRTTSGRDMRAPLWQVLLHVVNHGTQHRAEAALILTAMGRSPGDVDLIVYVRQLQAEGRA